MTSNDVFVEARKKAIEYLESQSDSKDLSWEECMEALDVALNHIKEESQKLAKTFGIGIETYDNIIKEKDAEIERLKRAICPDMSIKDIKTLIEHCEDLNHAFNVVSRVEVYEKEARRETKKELLLDLKKKAKKSKEGLLYINEFVLEELLKK